MLQGRRALLVTASSDIASAAASFLRQCGFSDICNVSSGGEARRCMVRDNFDLIIINMPLPDEAGDGLAVQLSSTTSAGIILLCRQDAADELTNRTIGYGAAVVAKPIHKTAFHQAISSGLAARNRLQAVRRENIRLQKKLSEVMTVSRAKCLLIEKKGMTEQEAHRYIEKQSMDQRRTREETAEEIISQLS